jgi:hypothetical protein
MDARQAFAFGFLLKCAEAGCGPETTAQLVKRAGWGDLFKVPGVALSAAEGIGSGALAAGTWGLLGAAGVGVGGGLAAAHLRSHSADPEEVKKQELIAAYNTFREQMKQRDALERKPVPRGSVRVSI